MERRTFIETLALVTESIFSTSSEPPKEMATHGSSNPPDVAGELEDGGVLTAEVTVPKVTDPATATVTIGATLRDGDGNYGAATLTVVDVDTGRTLYEDSVNPSYEPGDTSVYTVVERGDIVGNTIRVSLTAVKSEGYSWRLSPSATAVSC